MNKEFSGRNKEIFMYVLFGGATTVVNIITYFAFDKLGASTAVSSVVAWVISVLFAFFTNKIFVFESRIRSFGGVLREMMRFASCRILTGCCDLAIMVLGVDFLKFADLPIKIIANVAVVILNYVASKLFIFNK